MSGVVQGSKEKGSQKWLQIAVNEHAKLLNDAIRHEMGAGGAEDITWLSPLAESGYEEYRDGEMLTVLGVAETKRSLASFWPKRGPVWDGLAKTNAGDLLLVEAKAHIPEAVSNASGAGEKSLQQIKQALDETRKYLEVTSKADWTSTFYQYTNRLASLYYLRVLNELPAYLVFCYFYGDEDMNGPSTREHWEGAIEVIETYLGVQRHKLSRCIIDVFVDVAQLR